MKFLVLALFVAVATATAAPLDGGEPVELIVNGVPDGEPLEIGDIVDIQLKEHVDGEVVAASSLLHPLTAVGLAETAAAEAAAAEAAAAEAAAAEEAAAVPETPIPSPVALPAPALPEVVEAAPEFIPSPVALPAPVLPEVETAPINPSPVVLPEPVLPEVINIPSPVVLPAPAVPEVVETDSEAIPTPVALPAPVLPEVAETAPIVIPTPVALPEPVAPEVVETEVEAIEAVPEVAAESPNGEIFNDGTVSVTINVAEEPSMYASLQSWFSMVINYFQNGAQTTQQVV